MNRYIFVLLISSLFLSCEKELKTKANNEVSELEDSINDPDLEGLIKFQQSPKICNIWSDEKELEIVLIKTKGPGREFRLETYADGQMYEVVKGVFQSS